MKQLTKRQQYIYSLIQSKGPVSNNEIRNYSGNIFENVSRVTITRDIAKLLSLKLIIKKGAGRSTVYKDISKKILLKKIDPFIYFNIEPDYRTIIENFNFHIFNEFYDELFDEQELLLLEKLTNKYQNNIANISPEILKKDTERLTIELSWKSSQIEGNTYSLLDTEALFKEKREAPGHDKSEAIMLINHKKSLEYILKKPLDYTNLTIRKIEDIHRILVEGLSIEFGLRNSLVSITGSKFKPLSNQQQIKESLEKTFDIINNYNDPFHKTLILIAMLSYIQPFIDGNKRTARISGNAILSAYNACPLSYRSVDSVEYKKAMLLFYEQNSLYYFKKLFMEQYEFSVNNYFCQ